MAHAHALARAGVVDDEELELMAAGLRGLAEEIGQGKVVFDPRLEDVHMNVEHLLTARIGKTGAKLHTGRSRNDQVALDMRLMVREAIADIVGGIAELQGVLLGVAKASKTAVLPGLTHVQHAQPVLLPHHLLAHFWRLQRDAERMTDCYRRTNVSPLGSGALAGTSFKLDRQLVASMLGMEGITENSMDAVSDRDFVAEAAFALSLLQIHLSSLSEELVLWSSTEFGYLKLSPHMASGSSMMPQKLNPDIPELVRGKSGRAVGGLVAILTLLKSLPLTYNRDLQEDKENLFDVVDTAGASLRALTRFLAEADFDEARMRRAAETGLVTATDLADFLTTKGVPFREAHGVVKDLVAQAGGDDRKFAALAEGMLAESTIGSDLPDADFLSIDSAVERRDIDGGTSGHAIAKQIMQAERGLQRTAEATKRMQKDLSAVDRLLR